MPHVYGIENVLRQLYLCFQRCLALPLVLHSLLELRWLPHLPFQVLVVHQQQTVVRFQLLQLRLLATQLRLQSVLLQTEHVLDLINFSVLDCFQLDFHLFSHLNCFSSRSCVVMKDVHIFHSLFLDITLQFLTPVREEVVSALK